MALLGDLSGGALYLVIGVLSALLEARQSGRGPVNDAAVVDGTASMALPFSIGPVEVRFYMELLERIGINPAQLGDQYERANWAVAKVAIAHVFRGRTRQAWYDPLEGADV